MGMIEKTTCCKNKYKLDVAFDAAQRDFLLKELHPSLFEIL
jgi:hypothetical protein